MTFLFRRIRHPYGIAAACAVAIVLAGCFIDAIVDVNDAGRIWSESGTINCSSTNPEQSDCQEEYLGGGEELFFAQPDPGHKFLGWSMGHCAGVGSCYVPWSDEDNPTNGSNTQHVGVTAEFAPINPQPQTVSYLYNAMGQRVAKTVNGITTLYVYDIYGQLIAELDSSGNTLREYIYFDGQVIAHVESSGGDYDGVHYVMNDHLGRPIRVLRDPTDPNNPNETLWAMETEAFGEETGTFQKAGFSHNKRFPGQYYDQETGLSYNYFRDYDPSIGRYIQSDPIGLQGGINTYGYVYQNPVIYYDSYGLYCLSPEQIAAISGAIGGGVGGAVAGGIAGAALGPGGAVAGAIGGGVGGAGAGLGAGASSAALGSAASGAVAGTPGGVPGMALGALGGTVVDDLGGGVIGGTVGGVVGGLGSPAGTIGGAIGGAIGGLAHELLKKNNDCPDGCVKNNG